MTFVMRAWGLGSGEPFPYTGQYLKAFDPNGGATFYPNGSVDFTPDLDEAKTFADHRAALECWKTESTSVPLRPDGKPNRPLTAFTVEIVAK